jgi:hypothetical protein
MALYQDTLKVREYFLFDPDGDYLDPPLQGFRLRKGVYRPIRADHRRLPSLVLGLHLERNGRMLRLWNPDSQSWLLTPAECRQQAEQRAEQEAQARVLAEQRAKDAEQRAKDAERHAAGLVAEIERLRQQMQTPTTQE